jgi:hypothetical protein
MSSDEKRRDRILRLETRRVLIRSTGNVLRVALGVAERMVAEGVAEYAPVETAMVEPPESGMLPRARARRRGKGD